MSCSKSVGTSQRPQQNWSRSSTKYEDKSVDSNAPINSAHGQYLIALHIVLVHTERFRIGDLKFLGLTIFISPWGWLWSVGL